MSIERRVGRVRTDTLDSKGRVTQSSVTGMAAVAIEYDDTTSGRGRVNHVSQGARTIGIVYDTTTDAVSSVTDALNRTVTYGGPSSACSEVVMRSTVKKPLILSPGFTRR